MSECTAISEVGPSLLSVFLQLIRLYIYSSALSAFFMFATGTGCFISASLSPNFNAMAPANTSNPKAQKQALINALNERRVNTIGELRRIERIFASLGHPDLTEPMTSACQCINEYPSSDVEKLTKPGVYYVNSNSLLTELRGLTKQYPFRYNDHPLFPNLVTDRPTVLNASPKPKQGFTKTQPQTAPGTIAGWS